MANTKSSQEPVSVLTVNLPKPRSSQLPVTVAGNLRAINTRSSQLPVMVLVQRRTEQPRIFISS